MRSSSQKPKCALVVSRFNESITHGLTQGALKVLQEYQIEHDPSDVFYVPGAFEIPLTAQTLAQTGRYHGIICLGCVIQGDTAHFEFISLGATLGIIQSMLSTHIPITFGIITAYTLKQAQERSTKGTQNKGREAALACLEMIGTLLTIKENHLKN